MSKRRLPLWANATWFAIVLGTIAYYTVEAVRMHLSLLQVLGSLWFYGLFIAEVAIVSAVVLLGIVWLIDFHRGRTKPENELKADASDVGNLVP